MRLGALLLLVLLGAAALASAAPRRVLLIHPFERDFAPFDAFAGNLRTELPRLSLDPVEFFEVSIHPARFQEAGEDASFIQYVRATFADHPPDLVIPIGGPAVRFVQQHREDLFPATPTLLAAVDQRLVLSTSLGPLDSVVAVRNDPAGTVETILTLLPATRHLFVVVGTSPLEKLWRRELEPEFRRFVDRLDVSWSDDLSFSQLLSRAASLPPDSAIFYLLWSVDAQGVSYTEDRALRELRAATSAPLFGLHSTQLGHGIVGGPLMAIDDLSRHAAQAAARILSGEAPRAVVTPVQSPAPPVFDWRELRSWRIPESRLPSSSRVLYREPSIWSRYKWLVAGGAAVCVAEGLLIMALVVNRRKRRRAEAGLAELSRSLIKAREEERAWIARELHEDLCQQLVVLSIDLHGLAAQASPLLAKRVRDLSQRAADIAKAGRDLSVRVHSSQIETLGLRAAVASLGDKLAARHDLAIVVHEEGDWVHVSPQVSLTLFRVVEEALNNVVLHSQAEHVVVALRAGEAFEAEVIDDGIGFDARQVNGRGVGFVAMRERMNLVQGRISIESEPGMGTTIRAWAPASTAPSPSHQAPAPRVSNQT